MLTKLKEKIQEILVSEATAFHKLGLTPNAISLVGIVFAVASALAYTQWQADRLYLLVAMAFLLFSGFCDALDGVVARVFQQATDFGGFLDSLLDRYADAAVYAGIIIGGLCDVTWGLIALAGSLLVSYSRARGEAAGIKMESVGFAERAERIIILVVASFVSFFWQPQTTLNWAMILLALLSNLTVLQRAYYVYKNLKGRKKP